MKKVFNSKKITILALIVISLIMPFLVGPNNNYYMNILISFVYYGIIVSSLNLLLGYSGQISLGHSAYMAIGAYSYAILSTTYGIHFLIATILSIAITAIAGIIIGAATVKLNAIFLAITTLGLINAVTLIITNETWLTGGPNGFTGIQNISMFGFKFSNFHLYYLAVGLFLLITLLCFRIVNSKQGRAFRAIKASTTAAASMGVNVFKYRLMVNGISAGIAALAGVLYAVNLNYLSADMFNQMSVRILTMTIVGGLGNLAGPIIGSIVMGILPEALRAFSTYLDAIYGVALIIILIAMPNGIAGGIKTFIDYMGRRFFGKNIKEQTLKAEDPSTTEAKFDFTDGKYDVPEDD